MSTMHFICRLMKIVAVSLLDRLIIATTDEAQWPASNSINEVETGTEVVSLLHIGD